MGRLNLDAAAFTRASDAYNPHTGKRATPNVLRRNPARLRVLKRMFTTADVVDFAPGMTRMTYAQLLTRMGTFEANTAGWSSKEVLGQSFQGRDVHCYTMGDTDLPGILFVSGVHGNEVNGVEGLFTFFETLHAKRNSAWKAILDEHCIYWIPSANPDGWNANLRNLASVGPNGETNNLNRGFPWFWTAYIPSSAESKGAAPAGEVGAMEEADILYNFVMDPDRKLEALVDWHANTGQNARYGSANRVNSYTETIHGTPVSRFNKDWDWLRLQGAFRRMRELLDPADEETEWVQFRRSKNVPHFHSWASGAVGVCAIALESRKDAEEPEGPTGSCKFNYDGTFAVLVSFTNAWWRYEDTFHIERAATNLVTGQEWQAWSTDNVAPTGFSRSRFVGARSTQELFPSNAGVNVKVTTELAVDTDEDSPDWKACGIGDIVLAMGRKPSVAGDIQTMILATETVSTGAGPSGTPIQGASRGYGMVLMTVDFAAAAIGGWNEAGDTLRAGGTYFDAFNPGLASPGGSHGLPDARADMGFANDGTRYSVFVGGCTGVVSGAFEAPVDGKILRFDRTTVAWTDTGLTIPARKNACVVHRPGTDEFWIFGGEDATGVPLDDIWVYDRLAGTVTQSATDLPSPMTRIAGAAFGDDCIYLYGGRYEVSVGVYENDGEVRKFVPSTEALTVETVLANLDDEASHDETPWFMRLAGGTAARRVAGNGEEIFLLGGKTGLVASEVDQPEIFVHRPSSNTLTFARDGLYALFSKTEDVPVTPGNWMSMSSWAKAVQEGGLEPPYNRTALTFKNNAGTWLRHGRTYYEVPFSHKFQWFRNASPVKAGEDDVRPYNRVYVDAAEIIYDRWMVCERSRATTFHPGTRAAETLTFSEVINMNHFRLRFLWNPTFGFVNVGEDLELARITADDAAGDYLSLTLIEGANEKTYHAGNALVGPIEPQVELRKYVSNILMATVPLTLYYGYDCRSSNQEAYDDPVEFEIQANPTGAVSLAIIRYGQKGYAEHREFTDAMDLNGGKLTFAGEGEYGVPQLLEVKTDEPRVDGTFRGLASFHATSRTCIHPGEPVAY